MPTLKNDRYERFCRIIVTGVPQDEAYVQCGYRANKGNACRLRHRPEIEARIAELMGRAADKAVTDRAYIMGRLRDIVEKCMAEGLWNPSAANRALELLGKEIGMFVDRRLLGVRRIDEMSEEELLEFLGGEPDAEELRAAAGSPPAGHA